MYFAKILYLMSDNFLPHFSLDFLVGFFADRAGFVFWDFVKGVIIAEDDILLDFRTEIQEIHNLAYSGMREACPFRYFFKICDFPGVDKFMNLMSKEQKLF